ncbi:MULTISPECIES: aldo/keto reductase [unclassified Streptomyces]|uniref:aldo/keto reductase n=1 Tax=unclassified Streptomyces TaxID=2593676 RepID=UPI002E2898E0|nr:aldo/keto reductase [Streptomyces sp. NBC_00223]
MRYRRLGRTGLLLPEISLGLWQNFGDDGPADRHRAIVTHAFDRGVTHFDLANNYGLPAGSAEANFGAVLRRDLRHHRDELIISSKAGYRMWPGPYGEWGSRKYLTASLDQSLTRLGVDYVDVFYSHRPDPHTPLEETVGALADLVARGKALYVGISNYDVEQTRAAVELLKDLRVPLAVHQPRYSMLDRGPEEGLLDVLGGSGVGCVCYSPLAQGLLTSRYLDGTPTGSRMARGDTLRSAALSDTLLATLRGLDALARERGRTLAQTALSWALRDPRVTSLIVGASSVAQFDDSLAALRSPAFSDEELARVDRLLADAAGAEI